VEYAGELISAAEGYHREENCDNNSTDSTSRIRTLSFGVYCL